MANEVSSGEPAPAQPPIEPLSQLPVFLDLRGRLAVVAGGSQAAIWKAQLLVSAGARVDLYAPQGSSEDALAALVPISVHRRNWRAEDFAGAAIAIADAQDEAQARAFRAAARAHGAIVNIIDRPDFCDVQFGAIVNRSPLVIGVATGGAAPVFAQALRARLETMLPAGFARWAQAARDWRAAIRARNLGFHARRAFWQGFADAAMRDPAHAPDDALRARLLEKAIAQEAGAAQQPAGHASIVGAGPGDPELITLKALRALQSADVVLYDDLVSPPVLDYARREAMRVHVGKRGHKPSWSQADICALLVSHARAGRRVVRLKGGDPMIFGRASEEIVALQQAGIPFEVIAGVTAASGAAASLAVSLSERAIARRVQFVTAHSNAGQLPEDFDWRALVDPRATTVVYMGVRTFAGLAQRLIAEGADPSTPVMMVESATTPRERRLGASLSTMGAALEKAPPHGPCLFLIGLALRKVVDGARADEATQA